MTLNSLTALEIKNGLRKKEFSAVELMSATIKRMETLEPKINAFVTKTPEIAMEVAKITDKAIMLGNPLGLLQGIPISVKDLTDVKGVKTTFGSISRKNNVAKEDAPAVERVRLSGAGIIGKTTTTEFGCRGTNGYSPLTGITYNPWDLKKSPGGSSSGAAASVAAGVTPFALGTDGGGSVRIPSALCGLFGMKAQFGRVPVYPTSATPTLAHVGVMSRTVRDAALLLQAISGFDARDPASVSEEVPDFINACDMSVDGLRIAWSPTLGYAKPTSEIRTITEVAARRFETFGCSVELVENIFDDPIDLWKAEFYAGVGVTMEDDLKRNSSIMDGAVVELLNQAYNQSMGSYYTKVFKRYQLREKVRKFFNKYDILITPTLPVSSIEAEANVPREVSDRDLASWVYYTYPFNLTGNPAASMPCGFTKDGMPVGLQIIADTNREVDILRVASAFESAYSWNDKMPLL